MRIERGAVAMGSGVATSASAGALVALALGVAALGAFAMYLNTLFYRTHGPFYDSVSYMNFMAEIMRRAREEGFLSALTLGANNTTVFLPWLESAALGLLARPSRVQGVLLQMPLVVAQVAAAYAFFRRVAGYRQPLAVLFALLTASFGSVFFFNGGLSDLRMDLPQALTFGTAAALLCVARVTERRRHWFLLGLALGVAFLVRATTPVYALLLLAITLAVDVLRASGSLRWRRLVNYAIAGATAAVLSAWFYVMNLGVLVDYYTVRNYDAMARLPLSESITHLWFVLRMHLGLPFCALGGAALFAEVWSRHERRQPLLRGLNWPMLLAGVVPVAFLVLFGTSLGNPYVSMVSAPGLLMFALAPYASAAPVAWPQLRMRATVFGAFAVLALTASAGVRSHVNLADPWTPAAVPLQQLTGSIDRDLATRGKKEATFEATYVGSLDSLVLLNSFVFDQGFASAGGLSATKNGMRLTALAPPLANPANWKEIQGATDEDKVTTLVAEAREQADYLVMPENGNTLVTHHPSTPYLIALRDRILAGGGITRIAGPIRVSRTERISVYRNDNRN